jgi:YVTN family beta-propeller protein
MAHPMANTLLLGLAVIAFGVDACGPGDRSPVQPQPQPRHGTVAFDRDSETLHVSLLFQPVITVRDSAGKPLPVDSARYQSQDTSVATASTTCVVRAVAPGVTWIVAVYDGSRDSMRIVVPTPRWQVRLGLHDIEIAVNRSYTVPFNVTDEFGNVIPAPAPTLAGDSTIFSTTQQGVITGLAPGTAYLRISVGAYADSVAVTVYDRFPMSQLMPFAGDVGATSILYFAPGYVTVYGSAGVLVTVREDSGTIRSRLVAPGTGLSGTANASEIFVVGPGTAGYRTWIGLSEGPYIWSVPGAPFDRVQFTPSADRVYFTDLAGTLTLMAHTPNATGAVGPLIATIPDTSATPTAAMVFSPDGQKLYAVSRGSIREVSTAGDTLLRTLPGVGTAPRDAVVSADGSELVVADEAGPIRVVNLATAATSTIPVTGVYGVRLTPDGRWLVATRRAASQIVVIDATTRAVVVTLHVGGLPAGITFNKPFTRIFVTNEDGRIHVLQ